MTDKRIDDAPAPNDNDLLHAVIMQQFEAIDFTALAAKAAEIKDRCSRIIGLQDSLDAFALFLPDYRESRTIYLSMSRDETLEDAFIKRAIDDFSEASINMMGCADSIADTLGSNIALVDGIDDKSVGIQVMAFLDKLETIVAVCFKDRQELEDAANSMTDTPEIELTADGAARLLADLFENVLAFPPGEDGANDGNN
jgi:hypothetical protein